MSNSNAAVRQIYRDLLHIARRGGGQQLQELREAFRKPTDEPLETRLKQASDKLSFLRITTSIPPRGRVSGKWVYKDGSRLEVVEGTLRDGKGKALSSFDGTNLDPESVTRHRKHLKNLGFSNNLHAKGFF